jgi:dTDP-4-amino-4,6-dideoxygalactose transaminase
MTEMIPFVDLRAQHEEIRAEIEAAIQDIINRSSFIGGSYVSGFEVDFASYIGANHAIGVGNGTDALWLILTALGIGAGDAVITVPNTFIATVEAITRSGAAPIFVDIDLQTATIDAAALQEFLQTQCARREDGSLLHLASGLTVKAIMPVHLYGLPADMAPLLKLAGDYGLKVVEDACQSHGAHYRMDGRWVRTGTLGVAAGFSFYPGKNLGAMGDAGAVTTDDPELAERIRYLRDHGSKEKYVHATSQGWNSRLDAIQAAILSIKLKRLDEWNACRRQAAALYRQVLAGLPLELPLEPDYGEHVYHLYVVRSADRETLRKELIERKVNVAMHYPIPLHLQKAYEWMGLGPGAFPQSELSASTGLSLPMHPALRPDQIERVGQACAEILNK